MYWFDLLGEDLGYKSIHYIIFTCKSHPGGVGHTNVPAMLLLESAYSQGLTLYSSNISHRLWIRVQICTRLVPIQFAINEPHKAPKNNLVPWTTDIHAFPKLINTKLSWQQRVGTEHFSLGCSCLKFCFIPLHLNTHPGNVE